MATYSTETHPGNMPIRVLQHNIFDNFKNIRDTTIAQHLSDIAEGKKAGDISYSISNETVSTPFLNCQKKLIYINESYLSYLWAISYSFFVIMEKGIQERIVNHRFEGDIQFETPELINALNLLKWAISLTVKYSSWDYQLPNPEVQNNDEERYLVPKANGIFVDAINYILFHEYSHLVYNHCETVKNLRKKESNDVSDSEILLYKELEKEADILAKEAMIKEEDDEKYKLHKGLAVIIAQCSNLFIIHNPKALKSSLHPDIDTRIHNTLQLLNLNDRSSKDYLFLVANIAIKIFFDFHRIEVGNEPANTAEDLFVRYLNKCDEIKAG